MENIPNTEYITVNANGIFVGGKRVIAYRGESIHWLLGVQEEFAGIQRLNKNVAELHVLSSETCGESAKPGNPSGKHGPNAWCRVKFENGNLGAWVFLRTYDSVAGCAYGCAYACAHNVRNNASFRSAVFGATIDEKLTDVLQYTDLSKFIGKHTIGSYEIVVRNKQNTKE